MTCDGWYRNAGTLKYIATPGPASFEGGSIIEDILHISDLINSEIRNNFTAPGSTRLPLAASACNTIGTSNPGQGADWDSIIWSAPPVVRFPPALQSQVEVTPLALKRLPARMLNGTPIGTAVEKVKLETYANFHIEQTGQMSLRENDQVALNLPAMVLRGEPTTNLVVIGNVLDEVLRPNDSAFSVSDQSANYSPGTYTMQLTTNYWMPPTPPQRKPTMITVPTYELTYNVKYTPSPIVQIPVGAL